MFALICRISVSIYRLLKYNRFLLHDACTFLLRYVLLPCSSWDSLWNGVAQWFGVTEEEDLNYVLPNRENFGCRLFTDVDLYKGGQNYITGCNGDTLIFDQSVLLNDSRYLTGEEQKGFCELLKSYVSFATNNSTMRCVVVDQQVSIAAPNGRRLEQAFRVSLTSEVSCDWKNFAGPAGRRLNEAAVRADMVYQLSEQKIIANITGITETVITTNSPTSTPSSMPSVPRQCHTWEWEFPREGEM
jgi:hypothetical protein